MKALALAGLLLVPGVSRAQDTTRATRDSIARLGTVQVTAGRSAAPATPVLQRLTLPASAGVTAAKVHQTVNLVDAEDAVKYLPSVFLRKRNNGDTQAVMGTRVWGVSSSARSLVFADGVPLTALIANNNTIGAPRWGLVSPIEIARMDVMYGPFSAAYAGNSMGAVLAITTRLPDSLEATASLTRAVQRFELYGTRTTLPTTQLSADVGDRFGRLAFWLGANVQRSNSQPLTYVTAASPPSGTTGSYAEQNKLGANAPILGASGLLATDMTNLKLKFAYDLTPRVRASYTVGLWKNDASSAVETYLRSAGEPTYSGQAGFASGLYALGQTHTSHSVAVRSDLRGRWDFSAVATRYRFDRDRQRSPSAASDTSFGTTGRVAVLDGTGWTTLDLEGAWRSAAIAARHTLTFGAHHDEYSLRNPTYTTPDWRTGDSLSGVATEGDGRTRTRALWAQDSWWLTGSLRLTAGGRYEWWRAFDGFNANGASQVTQPVVAANRFSPKAVLTWSATDEWQVTGSVGKAYRFATAGELYQLVSTGATFTSPDPNLRPDDVLATELRVARRTDRSLAQAALFYDDVHDAIIAQYLPLVSGSPTLYSYLSNVDHVRARGVELTLGRSDALVRGLELTGSATYLDARTLALSGRASASAPAGSAVGAFLPNIPRWRANATATYHPPGRLTLSLAGRYSSMVFTTLDNADVNPNTYQGFGEWFVADARATFDLDRHYSASLGVDNLLDRKYFLFHPFPQRTLVATLRYAH